jgi:hypothetical protein
MIDYAALADALYDEDIVDYDEILELAALADDDNH